MPDHQHSHAHESGERAPEVVGPEARRNGRQDRYGNGFMAERLAESQEQNIGAPPSPGQSQQQSAESGATIRKLNNPLPAKPEEQRREVLGVIIIGRGVSPTALDACELFVQATLSRRPDVQDRLRRARAALVIIPHDKKMTQVAEFSSLAGTKTVDGRLWDEVRGSGGMRVAGGLYAIGVPEENLVAVGTDGYSSGYSVGLHELAHAIHQKGMTDREREQVTALYAARKKAGGPWTEDYGASNEWEYVAQATNCFFNANDWVGNNGPEWLQANDLPMFNFLRTLYGEPPRPALNGQGQ